VKFIYHAVDHLPKLAWCAQLEKDESTITVVHGSWIETHEQFFFEGVWDGEFSQGNFHQSTACFGSGARITKENQVIFVTPIHNAERIYAIRQQNKLILSNSIIFLLTFTKEFLDPSYFTYGHDIDSMRLGIHDYVRTMPLQSGNEILIYIHRNIFIDSQLNITETVKLADAPFVDYAHYRSYLSEKTALIAQNLQSQLRKIQYQPITTLSTGYDSPAMSVLAKEIGCQQAITISEARRYHQDADDSGVAIAEHLAMQITQISRMDYKKMPDCIEAEFLISGGGGQEILFAPFAQQLSQRVLFTGCSLGRLLTANAKRNYFNQLKMGDASSSSWLEFRLRVGFLYLPLGFLGFQQHSSLIDIARSQEMQPYYIPGNYNKPIARRMVEEAGVPRELFGQEKKAVSVVYLLEGLENYLTTHSYRDYLNYYQKYVTTYRRLRIAWYDLRCRFYFIKVKINYYLKRISSKLGINKAPQLKLNEKYKYRIGQSGYLFHWSYEKLRSRYDFKLEGT
jgi:hypothetical protein